MDNRCTWPTQKMNEKSFPFGRAIKIQKEAMLITYTYHIGIRHIDRSRNLVPTR